MSIVSIIKLTYVIFCICIMISLLYIWKKNKDLEKGKLEEAELKSLYRKANIGIILVVITIVLGSIVSFID